MGLCTVQSIFRPTNIYCHNIIHCWLMLVVEFNHIPLKYHHIPTRSTREPWMSIITDAININSILPNWLPPKKKKKKRLLVNYIFHCLPEKCLINLLSTQENYHLHKSSQPLFTAPAETHWIIFSEFQVKFQVKFPAENSHGNSTQGAPGSSPLRILPETKL